MNYEKKYEEITGKIKKAYLYAQANSTKAVLEEILPELKESEDERIRKALIEMIHDTPSIECEENYNVSKEYILSWLERQDEQKSFDYENANIQQKDFAPKEEPKFNVGDWITNGFGNPMQISSIDDDMYFVNNDTASGYIESTDKEYHLWTIQDAKDGDLIYVSTEEKGIQAIFHEYINKIIFFHCFLCQDFVQGGNVLIDDVELVYPLQKTHYKRFFEKMHEAGYEFDFDKKELKKIK